MNIWSSLFLFLICKTNEEDIIINSEETKKTIDYL